MVPGPSSRWSYLHHADATDAQADGPTTIMQMVPRPSCRWSTTIMQVVHDHHADGPRPSCRWSTTIMQMVNDHHADAVDTQARRAAGDGAFECLVWVENGGMRIPASG